MAFVILLIELALIIVVLGGFWKVAVKAGQPGWAALIPIYNCYILLKVVGRPAWWLILLLIPAVNLVVAVLLSFDAAKSFGKSMGFAIGLLLLGFIFYPILGYGNATYQGPSVRA